jgi:hypothetical protein
MSGWWTANGSQGKDDMLPGGSSNDQFHIISPNWILVLFQDPFQLNITFTDVTGATRRPRKWQCLSHAIM